jgi:hypothetical protein
MPAVQSQVRQAFLHMSTPGTPVARTDALGPPVIARS